MKKREEFIEPTEEEKRFLGSKRIPRKTLFNLEIPYKLRFPLAWTLFFIIIGVAIQSIQAERFIFADFFASNYILWFKSFGSFVDITLYESGFDLFKAIMVQWYYFFYTGGIISLIWILISIIINSEIKFTKNSKK